MAENGIYKWLLLTFRPKQSNLQCLVGPAYKSTTGMLFWLSATAVFGTKRRSNRMTGGSYSDAIPAEARALAEWMNASEGDGLCSGNMARKSVAEKRDPLESAIGFGKKKGFDGSGDG